MRDHPPINEILARRSNIRVMSTIDLASSIWQVPLAESCRNYTGFLHEGKYYRFRVTPFGLSTSLASLARGLDHVLREDVKKKYYCVRRWYPVLLEKRTRTHHTLNKFIRKFKRGEHDG